MANTTSADNVASRKRKRDNSSVVRNYIPLLNTCTDNKKDRFDERLRHPKLWLKNVGQR